MDGGVPEGNHEGEGRPDDAMRNAERAMEEHEAELFDTLKDLLDSRIPPGATVEEAMAAMERALKDDPEVRALATRLALTIDLSGGRYLQSLSEPWRSEEEDEDTVYTLRDGPDRHLVSEEIRLMKLLSCAVEERLPADASAAERQAMAERLSIEDPNFARTASRLHEISESHDGALLPGLVRLAKEEQEEEEEEE
jgi:predicted RNase H-like HicB family nuclease